MFLGTKQVGRGQAAGESHQLREGSPGAGPQMRRACLGKEGKGWQVWGWPGGQGGKGRVENWSGQVREAELCSG